MVNDWKFLIGSDTWITEDTLFSAEARAAAEGSGLGHCLFTVAKYHIAQHHPGGLVQFYWKNGVCRIPVDDILTFEPFVRYSEGPAGRYEPPVASLSPTPDGKGFIVKVDKAPRFSMQQPNGQSARGGSALPMQLMYLLRGEEHFFSV